MKVINFLRQILSHPLNRNHKVHAIMRFVRWQLGSRLVDGDIIYPWVNGTKFIVRTGETGLTQNIYCGLQDYAEMEFLLHVLRKDDLFVDIGANAGSYTLLACGAVGTRGYAFEPVPSTYLRLMDNIRINSLAGLVHAFNTGIGDRDGERRFTSGQDTMNHVVCVGDEQEDDICIKVSTLDSVLKHENPCVMKIDVEGYETLVLKGANEVLGKESLHSIIIELNGNGKKFGFDDVDIVAMLAQYGFRPFSYDPRNRSFCKLDGKNKESANTIFLKKIDYVEMRCKDAAEVILQGIKI